MLGAKFFKIVVPSQTPSTNMRSIHYKGKKPNYYEILRLKPSCSNQDIKRAYIDLSKKFHPDRNIKGNGNSQHFVAVAEAYSILSKEDLRRNYDLATFTRSKAKQDVYYGQNFRHRNPMDDTTFYWNRDRSKDAFYQAQPYYGIEGVPRMPNSIILLLCFFVMGMGIVIQGLTIRYSFTLRREELLYKSELANEHLQKTRETAEQNGNKLQLQILEEKFRNVD